MLVFYVGFVWAFYSESNFSASIRSEQSFIGYFSHPVVACVVWVEVVTLVRGAEELGVCEVRAAHAIEVIYELAVGEAAGACYFWYYFWQLIVYCGLIELEGVVLDVEGRRY